MAIGSDERQGCLDLCGCFASMMVVRGRFVVVVVVVVVVDAVAVAVAVVHVHVHVHVHVAACYLQRRALWELAPP
ncbi:hypothetical protein [Xanthomonas campestris]|uniref:hypothetical protein n=1 Tax=Xanthomonas campestris TaxID=339 RepID=UPI0012903AE9|nr:hypothetical protein [Xanthomonas campestris]